MKYRVGVAIFLMALIVLGCSREISSIRFYPNEVTLSETETYVQEEELYFKLSDNDKHYHNLNIIEEVLEDDLKAESVIEFNIKIPENAYLNDFCLYKDEMYYTYNYSTYELESFYEHNIIEHTEELYTRIMSYNYSTGETRCIYEIDTPGVFISSFDVEENIIVLDKYYYRDMEIIYGDTGVDDALKNSGRSTEIINLETGTIMKVDENEKNGVLIDLTPHPYLIYSDYITACYKYDYKTEKTTTLIDNMDSFRVFFLVVVVAHLIEYNDYKKVVLYDYNGEYVKSFTTNIPYIFKVFVNDGNIIIEAENFDKNSVFVLFDNNGDNVYMIDYNPMLSDIACSENMIYMGGYGNNGIRVFDINNKKISENYYNKGELSVFYSSTGGVYTCKGQYGPAVIEDGNQIIEFAVFNQ